MAKTRVKGGGDATRGLFTRDYTSYEANGTIKYRDQYEESSQEVVEWDGILSLTDGRILTLKSTLYRNKKSKHYEYNCQNQYQDLRDTPSL